MALVEAVETDGLQRQGLPDAIVEHAEAASDYGFALPPAAGAHAKPRRGAQVAPVVDIGLGFVAQPQAQGEVRAQAPVVLQESAQVGLSNARQRVAGGYGELGGTAAEGADLVHGIAELLEVERAAVAFERGDRLENGRAVAGSITGWLPASWGAKPPPKVKVPPKFWGE